VSTNIRSCYLEEIARHISAGEFNKAIALIDSFRLQGANDFDGVIAVITKLPIGEIRDRIVAHLIQVLGSGGEFSIALKISELFSTNEMKADHEGRIREAMAQRMESAVG
jgi:hypothetical protein